MKVFIGLLILCGTYSAHSASVGVSQTSLCADQNDGVLIPVAGDCSQFYICLNGKEVLQSCGVEVHFDPENNRCIEVSKSRCVDGLWISSSETKAEDFENLEEVAKEEKPIAPTAICQGKAIGAFVPSRSSCSEYYVCIGSTPMLKTCKGGLHFDSFSRACVDPELSNCVVKDVEPVKAEEPVKVVVEEQIQLTEPEVTTTILVETICLGQPNGAKFAVPGSCSKYFACLQHRAYEKSCGVRHFSSAARSCVDVSYSECVEGDAVLEAEEEIEEENEVGKVDEEINFAKLPKYIVSEGKLILNNKLPIVSIEKTEDAPVDNQVVAVSTIEKTEVVEEPIKPEEPVKVVIDEQLTELIETTKILVETICLSQPNGAKFLVPGTCSKYFVCLQHRAYEKSCGVRHFSSTARSCVDVSYSECVEGDAVLEAEEEIEEVVSTQDNESEAGRVDEEINFAKLPKYIVSEGKLILNNKLPIVSIEKTEDAPVDNQVVAVSTIEKTEVVEEPIKPEEPVKVVIDEQLTEPVETIKILVETICLSQPNGAKFLVPGTCSKYFVCLQHRAYEKSCGVRHFSSTARSCVDVSYSKCVEGDAVLEAVKTEEELKDVSNTLENEVGKVDHVETTNTELAEHSIHPKYIVSEGKLILNNKISTNPIKIAEDSPVDNQFIELKTEDSPVKKIISAVNYIEESHIDNADIIVITKDVDGEFEAHDTGVDVEYVDPNHEEEDETTEVVLAVADNDSADKCVGVTSGILLPKDGSCRKFITCQDSVAFVGQCPSGLHFNADTKICDWPELVGCTEVQL